MDINSDQFMNLLTDALRGGPGTPEWNQAVKALRASDQNVDELNLLCSARERLESGKEYRSVKPGVGFTKKVLEGLEEPGKGRRIPTANLIAILAAGAILAVVIGIGVMLSRGSGRQNPQIEELTSKIFGQKILSTTFVKNSDKKNPFSTPEGWTTFGTLPLAVVNGSLNPAPTTRESTDTSSKYQVGGLVTTAELSADVPLEVDMLIRMNPKSPADDFFELFITDEPISENTNGGHVIAWSITGKESRVFLDGKPALKSDRQLTKNEIPIKFLINRDFAVIEIEGQRLYAGANMLSTTNPRYMGIRFRHHQDDKNKGQKPVDHVGIVSVTLQKP